MKTQIIKQNAKEILENYPIADLVTGWYFRVQEISPGGYQVNGTDLFGRKVSRMGTDPDDLLEQCARDANEILTLLEME